MVDDKLFWPVASTLPASTAGLDQAVDNVVEKFWYACVFHFSGWACVLHVQIIDLKNQLNQRLIFLPNQHVGQAAWLRTSMLSVDDSQETHLPLSLQAVGQSRA